MRLRVVAEVNGQFSEEESASLVDGFREPLKLEKPLNLGFVWREHQVETRELAFVR